MEHADKIVIGGAMANTFLMGVGIDVGKSLYEPELVPVANVLMKKRQGRGG